MKDDDPLIPISIIARRLRVKLRWLREECEAGRVPALNAGGVWLANYDMVAGALLLRIVGTDSLGETQGVQHVAQ